MLRQRGTGRKNTMKDDSWALVDERQQRQTLRSICLK